MNDSNGSRRQTSDRHASPHLSGFVLFDTPTLGLKYRDSARANAINHKRGRAGKAKTRLSHAVAIVYRLLWHQRIEYVAADKATHAAHGDRVWLSRDGVKDLAARSGMDRRRVESCLDILERIGALVPAEPDIDEKSGTAKCVNHYAEDEEPVYLPSGACVWKFRYWNDPPERRERLGYHSYKVSAAVLARRDLSPLDKLLTAIISGMQEGSHRAATIKNQRYADLLNCGVAEVRRAMARLKRLGIIESEPRYRPNGSQTTSARKLGKAGKIRHATAESTPDDDEQLRSPECATKISPLATKISPLEENAQLRSPTPPPGDATKIAPIEVETVPNPRRNSLREDHSPSAEQSAVGRAQAGKPSGSVVETTATATTERLAASGPPEEMRAAASFKPKREREPKPPEPVKGRAGEQTAKPKPSLEMTPEQTAARKALLAEQCRQLQEEENRRKAGASA